MMKKILLGVMALMMGCHTVTAQPKAKSIVILYENDVHCGIDGYTKMAGLRDAINRTDTAYAAAVCVGDFLHRKNSKHFGRIQPTYQPGTQFVSPDNYLPSYMCETLRAGLCEMNKRLKGFACEDAVLTGVESRSTGIKGFYPCGEGAGYAGGITSAAVDGIKCAEALIKNLNQERT